jgi:Raf kinase inhibitor-like YbhB/YbcL family protein
MIIITAKLSWDERARMKPTIASLILLALLVACAQAPAAEPTAAPAEPTEVPSATSVPTDAPATNTPAPFVLTSGAIPGDVIPDFYSCKGENVSPDFDWGDPPAGTQSFALIFDDPDAGGSGWVHWVIFNIPPDARRIGENVNEDADLSGGIQGTNSWGQTLYGGPCPPQGQTHNYVFTLFALDTMLDLDLTATRQILLSAMEGHILAETSLTSAFTQ